MCSLRHRFCIAGTQSGAGKTTVTLGLMAALRRMGYAVQPFKCGPDYIDAGYHRHAAGRVSRNLDSWMMPKDALRQSFERASADADISVCEGVMGLFDGASASELNGSTAEIATLIQVPVILVVDARAMARSIAALVAGFVHFESSVQICGVIANRVGSAGHAAILREALASANLPPLLGAMPRAEQLAMPERHLGLVADTEDHDLTRRIERMADWVEAHVELRRLLDLTVNDGASCQIDDRHRMQSVCRLGLARDAAFHFYYEDNLDALRLRGVELVEFSPLEDRVLPADLDGLYIGGGFPEQFAEALSANEELATALRVFAQTGRPIFAECGGYMYLCRDIELPGGQRLPLTGVLPASCHMRESRQRLGYTQAKSLHDTFLGAAGTYLRGHEFHWSEVVPDADCDALFELKDTRGRRSEAAGMQLGAICASYFHPHFASNSEVVDAWVSALRKGRA